MNVHDPYRVPSSALPPADTRGSAEDSSSKWTKLWFRLGQVVLAFSMLLTVFLAFVAWRGWGDPHGFAIVLPAMGFMFVALPMAAIGITAMVTCRRKAA